MLKRQIARLAEREDARLLRLRAGILPVRRDLRERARPSAIRGLKTAGTYIEDYHILQTTKEEGVMRAIRNGLQGAGIPVENSKGEWGPGQEEINVRYADALEMADRHAILKNGVKEIAHAHGKAVTFMAKWDYGLAGSSSHIHASLWDAAGKKPLFFDPKAEHGMSALMRQLHGRAAEIRRATSPISSRPTSTPTSASRSAPSRRPRRSGAATTAPPASGSAARAPRRSASNAASAAPTSTPTSPSRPCSPPASRASRRSWSSSRPSSATPITARAARGPEDAARRDRRCCDKSKMLRAALGDDVVEHYVHTAELGAVRIRPPHHRLGVEAGVREVLKPKTGRDLRPGESLVDLSDRMRELQASMNHYGEASIKSFKAIHAIGDVIITGLAEYLGAGAQVVGVPPFGDCHLKQAIIATQSSVPLIVGSSRSPQYRWAWLLRSPIQRTMVNFG